MNETQPSEPDKTNIPVPGRERRGPLQVVEFLLGNERFAFDLFDVREVVEYTTITKLPNVPEYVKGIIDLRGEITTIIDLRQRLNVGETDRQGLESNRIIVLDSRDAGPKIGILVDDVASVSTFDANQIDYTTSSVTGDDTAILGIIKRKVRVKDKESNELIIWIDIRQLVSDFVKGAGRT